jgi:vancomycin resistance protein YoaR
MFKFKLPSTDKTSKPIKNKYKIINRAAFLFVVFLFILTTYNLSFIGKVYPNISVATVELGGQSQTQALGALEKTLTALNKTTLLYEDKSFEIESNEIALKYDYEGSVKAAYGLTRTGNFFYDLGRRLRLIYRPTNLGLYLQLNESKLEKNIQSIAKQIDIEPVYPSIKLEGKNIVVDKGQDGMVVDTVLLRNLIGQSLAFNQDRVITVPVKRVNPVLSGPEAELFSARAQRLVDKMLVLKSEELSFTYKDNGLFNLLSPNGDYYESAIGQVISEIVTQINREPQEPVFVFDSAKVSEFSPAKDGLLVKEDLLRDMIVGNLRSLEGDGEETLTIDIPIVRTAPKTATKDVNNLGIKELIGKGTSRFAGSIPNRIHNIQLATGKMKGVLILPGEVFSFNDTLGDVSSLTGFKQAYVIKEGKTILGDGGGVCQVSTTFFRAALNAGLPIVERAAHAYRVGYYEQNSAPGFDATVYAPHPDLKIKNDTPGYLLIQPSVDLKNVTLVFEIYGTSDGRIATVSKPVISSSVAPGEDIYTDDPTLPMGTVKQIEHKAWGAKVVFNYEVVRDGGVIYKKTFVSNYQPWQAIYLRGVAPVQ